MMPISKETLPHLGNANKGPIQRYTVKDRIFAKRGDMREASSYILVPASTTAKTPATAIPTSLKTKPSKAIGALVPACCPMEGGKIIFPAPKKIAKIMQDIPAICDNDSFFISLFSFLNICCDMMSKKRIADSINESIRKNHNVNNDVLMLAIHDFFHTFPSF